jgi:hypothetical protein
MIKSLLIITFLVWSLSSQIAYGAQFYLSGNQLQEKCNAYITQDDVKTSAQCLGYIQGIADMHSLLVALEVTDVRWCAPGETTPNQMAVMVIQFMQKNPALLKLAGSSLVDQALIEAFPCSVDDV